MPIASAVDVGDFGASFAARPDTAVVEMSVVVPTVGESGSHLIKESVTTRTAGPLHEQTMSCPSAFWHSRMFPVIIL
jgi:hypothetical protein